MTKQQFLSLILAALLIAPLSACVGAAVGAGATVGVAAAQDGGLPGAATDASIRVQITDAWFKKSVEMYRRLSMTVREGRVLVTGTVPSADMRVDAIRMVWQIKGVKQVINEIKVENEEGLKDYATDVWITSSINTQILLDKYIQSINYSIETTSGVVYLMGVAEDQRELDRVINYARNTKYVRNVVSYVRLRGQPMVGDPQPEPQH